MNKDELLQLVSEEQRRSIGFDLDAELTRQRQISLEYYKGQMNDLPTLPARSAAVSMDVRDSIQAILPDIMDIFTGGDDVVAFTPRTAEDEEQAKQETDYVQYTIFDDNDGWWTIYQACLDAFQAKTGVVKVWTEEGKEPQPELFEGKTWAEVEMASEDGEITDLKPCDDPEAEEAAGEPLFDFSLEREAEDGKVKIGSVAPEDITVARDTVRITEATYCAVRMRPRAQDLINQGIKKDLVDKLPEWINPGYAQEQYSRDTVNESTMINGAATRDLRQVLCTEHYIRLKTGKQEKLYCVLTGGERDNLIYLRHEEVSQIPLAVFTPYPVTHHFYGLSVADLAIDIQRIKTTLIRQMLDSGYFALNQRAEISEADSSEDTIDDYLLNEPGRPIRSRTGNAVKPVQQTTLNFDVMGQLEYMATVLEERTGVIRGAQGLNPDTMHDTASGALAMLSRAQRRIRMLARTLAETGFKDLYLVVHAMLRQSASKARLVRLRGKWIEVNPSQWNERTSMKIEIGLGAGGRDQDMLVTQQIMDIQKQIIEMQGGASGPLVDLQNVYNSVTRFAERGGSKDPNQFFTNPAENPQPPQPPPPDPQLMKVQAEIQLNQQKFEADKEKSIAEFQIQQQKTEAELELQRQKLQMEYEQRVAELDLKRQEIAFEATLKAQSQEREEGRKDYETEAYAASVERAESRKDSESEAKLSSSVRPGGKPG